MARAHIDQTDLFAAEAGAATMSVVPEEADRAELVASTRAELLATLARARAAERLPWPNYTQSTLAEMRFDSISRWLPEDEAAALRDAFATELDRLYALEPPPPH